MDDLFGLTGHCLDGKYEVEAIVAEGGFGIVYRGRHRTLRKPIAVKVLKTPASLDEAAQSDFREGFAREAETIARLDHPAIVRVLDFGVSAVPAGGEAPWMVLDWVAGETLGQVLDKRRGAGGRSPAEALELLRPILDAVGYAHDQGIAHRDIKPSNLMFVAPALRSTRSGRQVAPALRLLDFGIAKLMAADEQSGTGQTRTRASMVMFSLPYAAPEQVSGARTGPWTDVHALALILTEVLVDAAPYTGREAIALHGQVLAPQRPTPARFGVDVGPWEPVLARALSLMPRERFATAGEFLAALEADVPAARAPVGLPPGLGYTVPSAPPDGAFPGFSTLRASVVTPHPVARPSRALGIAVAAGLLIAAPVGVAVWLWRSHPAPPSAASPAPTSAAPTAPSPAGASPAGLHAAAAPVGVTGSSQVLPAAPPPRPPGTGPVVPVAPGRGDGVAGVAPLPPRQAGAGALVQGTGRRTPGGQAGARGQPSTRTEPPPMAQVPQPPPIAPVAMPASPPAPSGPIRVQENNY